MESRTPFTCDGFNKMNPAPHFICNPYSYSFFHQFNNHVSRTLTSRYCLSIAIADGVPVPLFICLLALTAQAQENWSQEKCLETQVVASKLSAPSRSLVEREKEAAKACKKMFEDWQKQMEPIFEKLRDNDTCQALILRKIALLEPEFKSFKPYGNVNEAYIKAEVEAVGEVFRCYHQLSPAYAQRFRQLYEETIFYGLQPDSLGLNPNMKAIHPMAALNPDSKRAGSMRKAKRLAMNMDSLSKALGAPRASLIPVYVVPVVIVVPR